MNENKEIIRLLKKLINVNLNIMAFKGVSNVQTNNRLQNYIKRNLEVSDE